MAEFIVKDIFFYNERLRFFISGKKNIYLRRTFAFTSSTVSFWLSSYLNFDSYKQNQWCDHDLNPLYSITRACHVTPLRYRTRAWHVTPLCPTWKQLNLLLRLDYNFHASFSYERYESIQKSATNKIKPTYNNNYNIEENSTQPKAYLKCYTFCVLSFKLYLLLKSHYVLLFGFNCVFFLFYFFFVLHLLLTPAFIFTSCCVLVPRKVLKLFKGKDM